MAATQFFSVNSPKIIVVVVRAQAVNLNKEETRLAENLFMSTVETPVASSHDFKATHFFFILHTCAFCGIK